LASENNRIVKGVLDEASFVPRHGSLLLPIGITHSQGFMTATPKPATPRHVKYD